MILHVVLYRYHYPCQGCDSSTDLSFLVICVFLFCYWVFPLCIMYYGVWKEGITQVIALCTFSESLKKKEFLKLLPFVCYLTFAICCLFSDACVFWTVGDILFEYFGKNEPNIYHFALHILEWIHQFENNVYHLHLWYINFQSSWISTTLLTWFQCFYSKLCDKLYNSISGLVSHNLISDFFNPF